MYFLRRYIGVPMCTLSIKLCIVLVGLNLTLVTLVAHLSWKIWTNVGIEPTQHKQEPLDRFHEDHSARLWLDLVTSS